MHLRRALLLFAIVLGFAALAASLAPPPVQDEAGERTATDEAATPPPPEPTQEAGPPEPAPPPALELRFVSGDEDTRERTLEAGERAVVTVAVESPGQVAIAGLGLLDSAEPRTPARFDVRPTRAGRYEIVFTPIGGEPERVGIIEVEAA